MQQAEEAPLHRRGCLGRFLPRMLISTVGRNIIKREELYRARPIDSAWFETTYHKFSFSRHMQAFHGYRLVQITDIHADKMFMTAERVANFVKAINRLQPDLVVITGDFATVYMPDPNLEQTLAGLRELRARDGVFCVLGNHDHAVDVARVRECVRAANVQELDNAVQTIRRGDQVLHLVGMDDLWPANQGTPPGVEEHLPRLQQLAASLPAEGTAILLVHEPDIADVAASTGRFDLQLSGHSHGGQVRIPLYGLLKSILPPLGRKYPRGLYHVGEMILYTNRGLGSPLRFNTRPEIAVMDLYASTETK